MAGGQAITEYDNADVSNQISLKKFSPMLRKLAKHLIESDQPMTISDACRELKLNIDSVNNTITRARKKGNDFTKFIQEQSTMFLHNNRMGVYKSLVFGAVGPSSTAYQDRKTFLQVVGDLKESTQINTSITLAIGMNVTMVTPADQDREKGVIDTEPVIPSSR